MTAGLHLDDVAISLAGRRLLHVHASVAPGAILTVRGPSGSGKSTLFALIAGFLDPAFEATGTVRLDGVDLGAMPPERRGIGLMFQDALLFPHMSVGQNLLFAIPRGRSSRQARKARAEAMLEEVELSGLFDRAPHTLSGGQAARVSLARTLLGEPRALLLDEPFSRLDMGLRAEIRALVFAEVARRRIPAVLVTHDPADTPPGGTTVTIG